MSAAGHPKLERVLKDTFGFSSFKLNQREIVQAVISGRDVFAAMPTGGGKSLCYQLPALVSPGLTLVVSPLISLMKDQVDAARLNGIPTAYLNSTLKAEEVRTTYAGIRSGEIKLLYIAPERFAYSGFLELAREADVRFIAVDEAHCISEWGHEFRPDYRELARLKDLFPRAAVAAFTATATLRVQDDIVGLLRLEDPLIVRASFDRPELVYRVVPKVRVNEQVLDFIRAVPGQSGIVYRASRKDVEGTARFLEAAGVRAAAYHAGLTDAVRHRCQEKFKNDRVDTVVATIAFGMGIDKADVRYVVHADLPRSMEGYYQETGRAGRDGETADCLLLYSPGDISKIKYHIDRMEDRGEAERASRNLSRIVSYARSNACRRAQLLAYFNQPYEPPCGACDVCRGEVESVEASTEARKYLSAVVRTGQRFGSRYVVDILRGADSERARHYGHNSLPTFGVGADRPLKYWLGLGDELVAQGFLSHGDERYRTLSLTPIGKELLFGKREFRMSRHAAFEKTVEDRAGKLPLSPGLYEHLREVRKRIAAEINRPPYMVFSDRTLKDMSRKQPASESEMLAVHGVGKAKLEAYGTPFLRAVAEYRELE